MKKNLFYRSIFLNNTIFYEKGSDGFLIISR